MDREYGGEEVPDKHGHNSLGSRNMCSGLVDTDRSSPVNKDRSRILVNRTRTIIRGTKGSSRTDTIYNMKLGEYARISMGPQSNKPNSSPT